MADSVIPAWAKKSFNNDDLEMIEASIREIETKTSAEVIPVVVRSSTPTGQTFILCALFIWAFLFASEWHQILASRLQFAPIDFGETGTLVLSFMIILGLGALIGYGLSQFPVFQRMSSSLKDQIEMTERRAQLEFYNNRLKETHSATGILIFMSLLERQVVVLADRSISEKMPEDTWDEVVKDIISGIKSKTVTSGLITGLKRCGEILAEHFPIEPNDKNELPNHLVIKE